jgi:hypothetical protein
MDVNSKSRGRTEHLWILALAAAAIMGSFALTPVDGCCLVLNVPFASSPVLLPETCMSRLVLGISCPGCGLTRSFAAMAHGEFWRAFVFNPMGPVLFVLCFFQVPYRIIAYLDVPQFRSLRENLERRTELAVWVVSGGLMIAWAARLLMEEPWLKLY